MGITISYRGRLAEPARIEDFEDRLVDFALEVGGLARIWRSWGDNDPDRMVRGVILDIEEPVTRWAAWLRRCPLVTWTPRIMACALCS